jgi:hypothetical protein
MRSASASLKSSNPASLPLSCPRRTVALVNVGRVDESLPVFAKAYRLYPKWCEMAPRLSKVGLLPDDPKVIARIVAAK